MHRMLNIMEYALNSLGRRWKKNFSLTIVYSAVVGFFASVVLLTSALKYESKAVINDLPELWLQQLAGGRLQPMQLALADSIQSIRGVQKVIPRTWGYYYDSPTGAVFTLMGSDSAMQGLDLITPIDLPALDSSQVICGSGFLESHYLETGDQLNLIDPQGELVSFDISGSFDSQSDLLTRDLIILSSRSARHMLGLKKNEATDMAVRIWNSDEAENIGFKISRRYPGIRVVSKAQLGLTYEALFSWRGGIFVFGALIALLAFLILAWDRASGLSREERKELGILKGIGWEISDVLWLKFWEGFSVSITATLLGIVSAITHIFIFDAWLIKPLFIGWSVIYPEFKLPIVIEGSSLLLVFLLSTVPYLSATIIPSWKGAITDPAEVMQDS